MPLQTITASELRQKDLQPPEMIVENLLPCGFTILAAPGKTGKSFMCLALADAVATGNPFFGFATKQGTVLYLALEDSEYRLKKRLDEIGSSSPAAIQTACRGIPDLDGGLLDQLSGWCKDNPDGRLVILDTIARIKGAPIRGLNAYESDTRKFGPVQEFANQNKISVLGISHLSKEGRYKPDDPFERITGSMGAFSVADCAWMITGKRGEDKTLHTTGRDIPSEEYAVRFNFPRWELLGSQDEVQQQTRLAAYNACPVILTLRTLLQAHPTWDGTATTLTDIVRGYHGAASVSSSQAVGQQIALYADLLKAVDGITFEQGGGGKAGRSYHFRRM